MEIICVRVVLARVLQVAFPMYCHHSRSVQFDVPSRVHNALSLSPQTVVR
jgi:hypothetical protein